MTLEKQIKEWERLKRIQNRAIISKGKLRADMILKMYEEVRKYNQKHGDYYINKRPR